MDVAVVLARFVLIVVFGLAGTTKLADLAGSRAAVAGFGIPTAVARVLGTLLPFAELAVAALLLIGSTARVGAIGAAALLGVFAIGIAMSLARGEAPDCHCFGQLHSEPVTSRTLVRDLVLAAIAVFVVLRVPPAGAAARWAIADLGRSEWVVLGAAVLVLAVLAATGAAMLGLLRQNGRLLIRVEALEAALHEEGIPIPERHGSALSSGLPVGTAAPDFTLSALDGESVTLTSLRARAKPIVMFFTDSGCGPCRELMPRVAEWQRNRTDELTFAIVTRRVSDETRAEATEHGLETVLVDVDDVVAGAYQAHLTPGAVLVDDRGRIAAPLAAGNGAIAALVERAGT